MISVKNLWPLWAEQVDVSRQNRPMAFWVAVVVHSIVLSVGSSAMIIWMPAIILMIPFELDLNYGLVWKISHAVTVFLFLSFCVYFSRQKRIPYPLYFLMGP